MSKRWALVWFIVLGVFLGSWGAALAQDQSLFWQRYDVNITVQPNSDILVEEIQQINFTSGSFHFGFAAIPTDRLERITDVSVAEVIQGAERAYTAGSTGTYGFTTANNKGNLEITWYFPPTRNSTHTYILRYRVVGGLRIYPAGDQLWWKAIAPDHNFPIGASRVTVTLPATFPQDQLQIASYGAAATSSVNPRGQVIFDAQNIPASTELEVRVQFPHGVVQANPPAWQAAFDRQQALGPILTVVFGALGFVFLIGGLLAVYLLWYNRGRDRPAQLVPEVISEPPSQLPAGIVGTLVDEHADVKDIIASIIDLAHRGALRMEEQKKEGFLGIGSGSDFVFHLQDESKAVRPFEKTLIGKLFGHGGSERRLSDLRQKFYTAIPELQGELYQEVVQEGFFPSSPQSTRNRWSLLGVLGLIVAAGLAFMMEALLGSFSPWAGCPGAALAAAMIGLIIVGRAMPRKTPQGAEETAKWLAFKRYLETIEKHADLQAVKDKFDAYLPYAVAFGLERRLISQFAAVDAPAPAWWGPVFVPGYGYPLPGHPGGGAHPVAGGPPGPLAGEKGGAPSLAGMSQSIGASLASMSTGLGTLLSSAGTVLTSTPPTSSSGHGGGGWSGGGFGGGGGGGGGSRGFG